MPTPACMSPSLELAQLRFQEALCGLLDSHPEWWVVYGDRGEQLHLTEHFRELETWLTQSATTPGTYIIRQIVPWLLNSSSNSSEENCQIVMCD